MKYLNKILLFSFLFNCLNSFGQWNFQTGYDFGVVKLEKITSNTTKDEVKWNSLQRLNFNFEFKFTSNYLVSLDLGLDSYSNKFNSLTTQNNVIENRFYHANIITFRNQLSIGYLRQITEKTSLVFKLSSGVFSIRNIKYVESSFERIVFEDDVNEEPPTSYLNEFKDGTDFKQVYGYGERYFSGLNTLQTSFEYRYMFNDWGVNLFLGYSPLQKEIIQRFTNNNLFLFGLRIGYTLPQKNKTNEK